MLFCSPGILVAPGAYVLAPRLGLPEIRDWTTLPRFLVLGVLLSFGYGLCATVGFHAGLPANANPYLDAALFGYVYVAGVFGIASVRGVVKELTPRAWFAAVGGIGTSMPALWVAVFYWID